MQMRSVSPTHGVGSFATIRGPSRAAKTPEHDHRCDRHERVDAEPAPERIACEPDREHQEERGYGGDGDVHRVGQARLDSPKVHRHERPGEVQGSDREEEPPRDAQITLPTSSRETPKLKQMESTPNTSMSDGTSGRDGASMADSSLMVNDFKL
jgi:hypothetical protein